MNKLLLGALATIGLGAATAGSSSWPASSMSAPTPPTVPSPYQALTFARERAIASRTGEIQIPADLADPERVRRGAGNYAAMCVNCHLSPEAPDSEIRKGLYPTPPNLSENRRRNRHVTLPAISGSSSTESRLPVCRPGRRAAWRMRPFGT